MMTEFQLGEHTYRIGAMDAMTQFHVLRRLSPVIGSMTALANLAKGGAVSLEALQPVAAAIGALPDEHVDYVISKTLGVVARKKDGGTGWAAVWNAAANRPMFDDIRMHEMLMIAVEVIKSALGPFSSGLPSVLSGEPQA